jgi:hypothetical protein
VAGGSDAPEALKLGLDVDAPTRSPTDLPASVSSSTAFLCALSVSIWLLKDYASFQANVEY